MVCASLALERGRRSVQLSQREFLDLGVDFLPLAATVFRNRAR
jgi:hypothetical protein